MTTPMETTIELPVSAERTEYGFRLDADVVLGAEPLADVRFLAFLRECQSAALTVHWSGSVAPGTPVGALYHLPPPTALAGALSDALAAWTRTYRYGVCYYRRGPGFVQVKDARVPGATARFILDHPCLLSVFLLCLTPCDEELLDCEQREAASLLAEENLLWNTRGQLVTLPTLMRRWPIPFMGV
ncbi:DUF5825 family protein [Streptomyces eurythermus]|uniref:DUF5825 family protein n=1 Tax=Streptomyces eurythermus TaxID=42237 RepID=UPI0033C92C8F